jgi:hypothetical protein
VKTGTRAPDLDPLAVALGIEPPDLWRHPEQPSLDALVRDQPQHVRELAVKLVSAILVHPERDWFNVRKEGNPAEKKSPASRSNNNE